jgi:hypothetical protein
MPELPNPVRGAGGRLADDRGPRRSRILSVLLFGVVTASLLALGTVGVLTDSGTQPGALAIASNFAFAQSNGSVCPAGSTFSIEGCAATHYRYLITIARASVEFGDVAFGITTSSGSIYTASEALGFTIVNATGALLVQAAITDGMMSMSSTGWSWSYAASTSVSSPVLTSYILIVDLGTTDPSGLGLSIVALGMGTESGSTAPIPLP